MRLKKLFFAFFITVSFFLLNPLFMTFNASSSTSDEKFSPDHDIIEFSSNILISKSDILYSHHVEPTLAISPNNTIFAGWKDALEHNSAGVRVSFSKSSDYGTSWTDPLYMPMFEDYITGQSDPWMSIYDDTLFYSYLEYGRYSLNFSQITMAKSTDYGSNWNSVSATTGSGFADKETFTISKNGTIYVVYDDIVDDVSYGKISRSDDFGDSFSDISIFFDNDSFDDLGAYVTTDKNGYIYIAWSKFNESNYIGDVYFDISYDRGLNFGKDIKINTENKSTFTTSIDDRPSKGTLPVLKFDSQERLYLAWADLYEPQQTWDIYLRYSDDYGKNWSERFQINENVIGNQWMVDFDIDDNDRLHFAWLDEIDDQYKPFYRSVSFSDDIADFSPAIPVGDTYTSNIFTRPGDYLTLRVDSLNVPHIVWSDGRESEMDIYYAHGIKEKISSSSVNFTLDFLFIPIILILFRIGRRNKKKMFTNRENQVI